MRLVQRRRVGVRDATLDRGQFWLSGPGAKATLKIGLVYNRCFCRNAT